MFENLEHVRDNYKQLELKLADPAVLSDMDQFRKYSIGKVLHKLL